MSGSRQLLPTYRELQALSLILATTSLQEQYGTEAAEFRRGWGACVNVIQRLAAEADGKPDPGPLAELMPSPKSHLRPVD